MKNNKVIFTNTKDQNSVEVWQDELTTGLWYRNDHGTDYVPLEIINILHQAINSSHREFNIPERYKATIDKPSKKSLMERRTEATESIADATDNIVKILELAGLRLKENK